jgi:hypothetical protein
VTEPNPGVLLTWAAACAGTEEFLTRDSCVCVFHWLHNSIQRDRKDRDLKEYMVEEEERELTG